MKSFLGTLGFAIVGLMTFRLVYGSWPPTEGEFAQWLRADSRARWALAAGTLAGVIGLIIGRVFALALRPQDNRIIEANACVKSALVHHRERRTQEAIDSFRRAITLYDDAARPIDAAPAYASLGKVYFDIGELNLAEENLKTASRLYDKRRDGRQAKETIERLFNLIAERRRPADDSGTYHDSRHGFSFCIPSGWLKQKMDPQFVRSGGRVAISHKTHAATLNVSAGPLDRPEWSLPEVRVVAAQDMLLKAPGLVGRVDVKTLAPISGEENVVIAEYHTRATVAGVKRQRNNGLVSILHDGTEFVIQWSAEADFETQVRDMIASFELPTVQRA